MRLPIKPYVGITDFTTWAQVQQMVSVFQANKQPGSERLLGVGVMMGYKTLKGIESIFSEVFPKKELIANILSSVGTGTFNCLHYADYWHQQGFVDDLAEAIYWGGSSMNAIQLDMTWPDPLEVKRAVQRSGRDIEVILQIGQKAFEEAGNDPEKVREFLNRYNGIIHRVLLDQSVGHGIPMKAKILLPYAKAIKRAFPELGLVVAGGLGPKTTHLIEPVIAEIPDISTDAEGQLRPSGDILDPIDLDMSSEYLIEMLKRFGVN